MFVSVGIILLASCLQKFSIVMIYAGLDYIQIKIKTMENISENILHLLYDNKLCYTSTHSFCFSEEPRLTQILVPRQGLAAVIST